MELAAIVAKDPDVSAFMSSMQGGNSGSFNIRLKPRVERKLSADEILQNLRREVAGVVGVRMLIQNPPPINAGGTRSSSQYQYALQSSDTDSLYRYTAILEEKLGTLPELQDLTSDLQLRNPEITVEIDCDRASSLGVSVQQIESAMARSSRSRP